jgi:hypothetical protein
MSAGLSKARLRRMHRLMSGHVERGHLPGLVMLVSHGDDVHVEADFWTSAYTAME